MTTQFKRLTDTTVREYPLNKEKTGFDCIPEGCAVSIWWEKDTKAKVHIPLLRDEPFNISNRGVAKMLGLEVPDMEQLEEWQMDSVCDSVLGNCVEHDGHDEYGAPSWFLAFGLI